MISKFLLAQVDGQTKYITCDIDNCIRSQTADEFLELICRPHKDGVVFKIYDPVTCGYDLATKYAVVTLLNMPHELQGKTIMYSLFSWVWEKLTV